MIRAMGLTVITAAMAVVVKGAAGFAAISREGVATSPVASCLLPADNYWQQSSRL